MVATYVTAPPPSLYQAAMHDGETNAAAEQCDEYTRATSKAKFGPSKAKFWPPKLIDTLL